jgi:hypothetical protein
VVTDLVVDAVIGPDATHAVAGLPGTEGTETLVVGLGRLRASGATAVGAAFPVDGDPAGLGGPAVFNADALSVGEAVVVADAGLGLVPERTGAAITWVARPAQRRPLTDVGEADRALRAAMPVAADALAALDVARWRPEVADELIDLRHAAPLQAPPGVPARCVDLAGRALQAMTIVDLALDDDGAAITSYEIEARRAALVPLERAGRHALVAACSPEVWPPA